MKRQKILVFAFLIIITTIILSFYFLRDRTTALMKMGKIEKYFSTGTNTNYPSCFGGAFVDKFKNDTDKLIILLSEDKPETRKIFTDLIGDKNIEFRKVLNSYNDLNKYANTLSQIKEEYDIDSWTIDKYDNKVIVYIKETASVDKNKVGAYFAPQIYTVVYLDGSPGVVIK